MHRPTYIQPVHTHAYESFIPTDTHILFAGSFERCTCITCTLIDIHEVAKLCKLPKILPSKAVTPQFDWFSEDRVTPNNNESLQYVFLIIISKIVICS